MNHLIFTDHLGKDAEQRFLQNGDSIVSFSVPCSSGFGDKKKTAWVRCSMFGKRGESVFQYLKKGTLVGVAGEFAMNEWEKDGVKNSMPECRVSELSLLGSRQSSETKTTASIGSSDAPDFSDDAPF